MLNSSPNCFHTTTVVDTLISLGIYDAGVYLHCCAQLFSVCSHKQVHVFICLVSTLKVLTCAEVLPSIEQYVQCTTETERTVQYIYHTKMCTHANNTQAYMHTNIHTHIDTHIHCIIISTQQLALESTQNYVDIHAEMQY